MIKTNSQFLTNLQILEKFLINFHSWIFVIADVLRQVRLTALP